MQNRRFRFIAGLVLLLGGVSASCAQSPPSQITYFPDISVPLTPKDIQIHPPVLGLPYPLWLSNLQFEDRNGVLFLTQPAQGQFGTKPENRVLWSGSFAAGRRKFTVVNANGDDQIQDDAGQVIASQKMGDFPQLLPFSGTITLEVSKEAGSIVVTDENHRFLETVPSETLRLVASSDDAKFRRTAQYRLLSEPVAATTQVDVNTPGLIYAQYYTAAGDWAGEKAVHALSAAWRYKTARVSGSQPGLDFWAAYFDKTGKRIGTTHDGFRTFP